MHAVTTTGAAPPSGSDRRVGPGRSQPVLAAVAVGLALWFAFSAPSVSPVVPASATVAPAASTQQGSAQDEPGAALLPVLPAQDRGRGRR